MSQVEFNQIGKYGLVRDLSGDQIAPEAWTRAENVECDSGAVRASKGWIAPYTSPDILVEEMAEVEDLSKNRFIIVVGEDSAYAVNKVGNVQLDTAGDLVKAPGIGYSIVRFHGWCLFNSAGATPKYWDYNVLNPLVAMPGWLATLRVKRMVPYKDFLVGLGVSKDTGSTWNNREVVWSNSSDPGSLPADWDYSDPTSDAGIAEPQGEGDILNAIPYGDSLIIYKKDSVARMDYVGGDFIMRFTPIFSRLGAVSAHAMCSFTSDKEYHLVVTKNDIRIHDMIQHKSILNERFRKQFFQTVNPKRLDLIHAITVPYKNEVWICYPEDNASTCTVALVWNYQDNTLVTRQIPLSTSMCLAVTDPLSIKQWDDFVGGWESDNNTWESDTATWDSEGQIYDMWEDMELTWNELEENPNVPRLCIYSAKHFVTQAEEHKLCIMDLSQRANGADLRALVEKRDLIHMIAGKNGPAPDTSRVKMVREIWPKIRGVDAVIVYIGSTMEIGGTYDWQGPFLYYPGRQKKVDCHISGRLFGIRFQSISKKGWTLDGYSLIVQTTSVY